MQHLDSHLASLQAEGKQIHSVVPYVYAVNGHIVEEGSHDPVKLFVTTQFVILYYDVQGQPPVS